MRLALVNGVPGAALSPWDRGLLYGDGCFETVRTYDGHLFALNLHLKVLRETAWSLGITPEPSASLLEQEARLALAVAGPGEWLVRLLLTRGEGAGVPLQAEGSPTRVVLLEPLVPLPESLHERGVEVELGQAPGGTLGPKTMAYLPNLLALQGARARGAAEVLWLDQEGFLGQGSSCNVLLWRAGVLHAPLAPGGRAGVTRELALRAAGRMGWPVDEGKVFLGDLQGTAELMLCSTIREILPVVAVGGKAVGGGRPGEVGRCLRGLLRQVA
jgi:branched-chain amino acid aminotransferase